MHGREDGENRRRSRHMWSVDSRGLKTSVGVHSCCSSSNSFVKDGRKITIGDCALFKSPHESPPFVGIIRSLTSDKESSLKLVVNWLYRPAEVILVKGVALEAAPNEVFYSFHRDETPAASLLHPCKVAFLPKGAELPSGVSSFVCRRVYDITNKCLWWLTDKDYINDWQEVDQLLQKSHLEMHTTVQKQQGTHSPKPLNGATATSPLKHSPDSMQNSSTFSSHKGKKRDIGDPTSESVKRERLMTIDDGDSALSRSESMVNAEIAKISEKGGLEDYESVERLVQFMQPEKSRKKIDLNCRSVLAGVIAGTDRIDCLKWFVQLLGVPVLDDWLQDVHKGKVGDSRGPKGSDKSVDDFLLVLLRALDKLPVSLNALQMCNIGKSVNHLRSHKNLEIQKKARSLVDKWKKRVEAELNINDAKSASNLTVSWPVKSRHDVPHGGNRHSSGSSESTVKNSGQYACAKSGPLKHIHGDDAAPRAGGQKSSPSQSSTTTNYKEGQARISFTGGGSEPPQTTVKEEKSSSSSQSLTNSQCSSDHARNIVPSGKEEARSSTARSKSNKTSGSSRHWKSANVLQGTDHSCVQKETRTNRNTSLSRIAPSEKLSHSTITSENAVAASVGESNTHKIIVKIPNRGRSPAQNANTGPIEDLTSRNSRASSPALSEKQDEADASLREKNNAYQIIEAIVKPAATPDGKQHGTVNVAAKSPEVAKTANLSTGKDRKTNRSSESSMSSINALIESCMKYSEQNASIPVGDDSGMNLLASVATGEISRSCIPSPTVSPPRNTPIADNATTDREGGKHPKPTVSPPRETPIADNATKDHEVGTRCNGGEHSRHVVSNEDSQKNGDPSLKSNGNLDEFTVDASVSVSMSAPCIMGKTDGGGGESIHMDAAVVGNESHDQAPDTKEMANNSLPAEDEVKDESLSEGQDNSLLTCPPSICNDEKDYLDQGLKGNVSLENQPPSLVTHSEASKDKEDHTVDSSGVHKIVDSQHFTELKTEDTHEREACSNLLDSGSTRIKEENDASSCPPKEEGSALASADSDRKTEVRGGDDIPENKEVEAGSHMSSKNSDVAAVHGERTDECVFSATNSISAVRLPNTDRKLEFDLNEGFSMDDVKNGEPINLAAPPFTGPVLMVSAEQSTVSSASFGLPASVTVAAAAKRPFVPPEDLLRNKTELGWKGSAATSAFRPAEPRKAIENAVGSYEASASDSMASKSVRPVLDIDLNVADEMVVQDMCCLSAAHEMADKPGCKNGGFELDLNRVDDAPEFMHHSASNFQRLEFSASPLKSSSIGILNGELNTKRNFDLNDGPAADESTMEPLAFNQNAHGNFTQSPFGLKMNNATVGSLSACYSLGTTYSTVKTPSAVTTLPDIPIVGVTTPNRVLGGPTALSFNPDFYRESVLSSSPAMPFTTTPFQYPVFPYGTSFPPTSSISGGSATYMDPSTMGRFCPPVVPSQLVGMGATVPSQYLRPCVASIPDASSNSVAESRRKWGVQSLDLNSGPGGIDVKGRDEAVIMASREQPAFNSHAMLEEQARAYQVAAGVLKRKEPEDGWDTDRLSYKQSSWQ